MINQAEKTLSEILVEARLLSRETAEKSWQIALASGESFYSYLIQHGLVKEDQILAVLSEKLKLDKIHLAGLSIDKEITKKIPVKFAWYYKFMPVKIENNILTIAVALPFDVKLQDEIRVHLGYQPKIVLAKESEIAETFKKYYGLAADTIDRILTKEPVKKSQFSVGSDHAVEDLEKKSEDASVIKLVNQIILEAYKKRATDIHIEPYRNKVRFRYRIDGVLVDANLPLEIKHFLMPILSRIKIMSNLSIVEKRLPQDGSSVVSTKDQTLDLRISTMPTPFGESMVIRILPSKVMLFSLEKLGLQAENVRIFRELVKKPHGIIFVTGPTGSGNTTTLYACLNEINSLERKIITIEDPIEYEMEGITQIQVNPKVNLDFARGLRSILRHDPDILMVGEVRDLETAEIAIRTALTGHLVFSSLHTNDAASGIARLIDMGLEPYLVSSSVEAFVAQRLVRVICPRCKHEASSAFLEIKQEMAQALNVDIGKIKIHYGTGCDYCNHTGFYGRIAIHEVLVMDEIIRAAVLEKPRADHIKQIAMQNGMKTLRQDGWLKVIAGVTTPMEVINVTSQEEYFIAKQSKMKPIVQTDDKILHQESVSEEALKSFRSVSREVLVSAKKEYDNRAYPRVREKIKIRYKVFQPQEDGTDTLSIKGDNFEHTSFTKDISAGGLLFTASRTISMDSILELKIQLEDGQDHITCLAKICRIEEDDATNMFSVATYYLDISSADRARIRNFVKSKS